MTRPPKTIEHDDPALPSPHLDHAQTFVNEITVRVGGFDAGLIAIVSEMEGAEKAYHAEQAERLAAYERDRDEAQAAHAKFIEGKDRLRRDLERARAMGLAAQAAYAQDIPVEGEDENHP